MKKIILNFEGERHQLTTGDFTPTEKGQRLQELAKQYHEETEAYDQTVCSATD